jgi:Ca-activated chloride channel family protein
MRARSVLVTVLVGLASMDVMVGRDLTFQELGEIRGQVLDDSGAVLPGATVGVMELPARRVVSDEQGRFRIAALPPRAYTLTAELLGFQTAHQVVEVRAGLTLEATLTLRIGALTETLTVMGESPRVEASRSEPRRGRREREDVARPVNRESYDRVEDNRFHKVARTPLSTFSVDVDTAGYANLRRLLNDGELPPRDAVRIEELINYFRYDYPAPAGDAPFSVTTELAACPWNPRHQLALIGLKGKVLPAATTPPRNLVFLIDVSGSMADADKLPFVQHGLRLLARELTAADRVAIVVYAGRSGLVLPPTSGDRREVIDAAIANLAAGGSTNGAAGIQLAYRTAREHFVKDGVNRVILATDGDFNVGVTSRSELEALIERERASGVFLSVLGVGTGNLQDGTMEMLADKGNGNYSYLDSLDEARRVLVEEAGGTLVTIAKDVKIQVEFNPAAVSGYRLIGYENRRLEDEDFNDDRKDAGEIGAGHSVTALYEIVPKGEQVPSAIDPLRYQPVPMSSAGSHRDELLTVKLRYKAPDGDDSRLITARMAHRVQPMSPTLGFASAVAEAGLVWRGSPERRQASLESAAARARQYRGDDPTGYRAEFIRLVELAQGLSRLSRR